MQLTKADSCTHGSGQRLRGTVALSDSVTHRRSTSPPTLIAASKAQGRMSKKLERKAAKELLREAAEELLDIVRQQDGRMSAGLQASLLYQRCPASKEIVQSYKGLKGFIAIPELEGKVGFADNQVRARKPTPPSPPPTNSAPWKTVMSRLSAAGGDACLFTEDGQRECPSNPSPFGVDLVCMPTHIELCVLLHRSTSRWA